MKYVNDPRNHADLGVWIAISFHKNFQAEQEDFETSDLFGLRWFTPTNEVWAEQSDNVKEMT